MPKQPKKRVEKDSNMRKIDRPCGRGETEQTTKEIQEWLCLNGIELECDGDYGPVTQSAVRRFQRLHGFEENGIVSPNVFECLMMPIRNALGSINPEGHTFGSMTVAVAEQHLKNRPRELENRNLGPWVRLYCCGNDGSNWAWCAGFATFIIAQAAKNMGCRPPLKSTVSCDNLAHQAMGKGLLLKGLEAKGNVRPGDVFLNWSRPGDWNHTGVVLAVDGDVVTTAEGNTNAGGSRNGTRAMKRLRGFNEKRDFIALHKLEG